MSISQVKRKINYIPVLPDNNDYYTTDAFDFNINRAAKWHNLNNRGCKPAVNYKLIVTALKGLNIRLVY